MNASKFTKGEWRAIKAPYPTGFAEWQIAWSEDDELVADVIYEEADAFLMAASKDLLSALKALVSSLEAQDEEGLIGHADEMIDARAAIAKAKGGK